MARITVVKVGWVGERGPGGPSAYAVAVDQGFVGTEAEWLDSLKADASAEIAVVQDALDAHQDDTTNPHQVTKAQAGLGAVDNTSDADKPVSTAQQAALDTKADVTALTNHQDDTANPHGVTKAQVGLGSADNTADLDKPVSTAQQAALDGKSDTGHQHTSGDVTDFSAAVGAQADVAANTAARHDHANKSTLDAVTGTMLVPTDGQWYQVLSRDPATLGPVWIDPPGIVIPTFLATLDGTLAYEDRSGVGTMTGTGALDFVDGYAEGSQAASVWEDTTNPLHNPHFANALTNWTFSGSWTTKAQDLTVTRDGVASLKLSVDADAAGAPWVISAVTADGTISAGQPLHVRLWGRASRPGIDYRVGARIHEATGGAQLSAAYGGYATLGTDDWVPIDFAVAAAATGASRVQLISEVRTGHLQAGDTIWLCQPQPEAKAYPTPFVPRLDAGGAPLPGHTWTGPAHASASTRAAATITLPIADRFDPNQGSVLIRYRPEVLDPDRYVLSIGTLGVGPAALLAMYITGSGPSGMRLHDNANATVILAPAPTAGAWHTAYLGWQDDLVEVDFDTGAGLQTATRAAHDGTWRGDTLYVGGSITSGRALDGAVGPHVAFGRRLSADERSQLVSADTWSWTGLIAQP